MKWFMFYLVLVVIIFISYGNAYSEMRIVERIYLSGNAANGARVYKVCIDERLYLISVADNNSVFMLDTGEACN